VLDLGEFFMSFCIRESEFQEFLGFALYGTLDGVAVYTPSCP
jgi:hypothetical protein